MDLSFGSLGACVSFGILMGAQNLVRGHGRCGGSGAEGGGCTAHQERGRKKTVI